MLSRCSVFRDILSCLYAFIKKLKVDSAIAEVSHVLRTWQVSWTSWGCRKQLKGIKGAWKEPSDFFTLFFTTKKVVAILLVSDNGDGTLSDYRIREPKAQTLE